MTARGFIRCIAETTADAVEWEGPGNNIPCPLTFSTSNLLLFSNYTWPAPFRRLHNEDGQSIFIMQTMKSQLLSGQLLQQPY